MVSVHKINMRDNVIFVWHRRCGHSTYYYHHHYHSELRRGYKMLRHVNSFGKFQSENAHVGPTGLPLGLAPTPYGVDSSLVCPLQARMVAAALVP